MSKNPRSLLSIYLYINNHSHTLNTENHTHTPINRDALMGLLGLVYFPCCVDLSKEKDGPFDWNAKTRVIFDIEFFKIKTVFSIILICDYILYLVYEVWHKKSMKIEYRNKNLYKE